MKEGEREEEMKEERDDRGKEGGETEMKEEEGRRQR